MWGVWQFVLMSTILFQPPKPANSHPSTTKPGHSQVPTVFRLETCSKLRAVLPSTWCRRRPSIGLASSDTDHPYFNLTRPSRTSNHAGTHTQNRRHCSKFKTELSPLPAASFRGVKAQLLEQISTTSSHIHVRTEWGTSLLWRIKYLVSYRIKVFAKHALRKFSYCKSRMICESASGKVLCWENFHYFHREWSGSDKVVVTEAVESVS